MRFQLSTQLLSTALVAVGMGWYLDRNLRFSKNYRDVAGRELWCDGLQFCLLLRMMGASRKSSPGVM